MGRTIVFIILFITSQTVFAESALLPKSFQELSVLFEDTLKESKARNYASINKQLESWLQKYPNSPNKEFTSLQQDRIKKAEAIFNKLKKSPSEKFSGIAIKIGRQKATINDHKNGSLNLTLVLSSSATKKETVELEKLPALSIYYILLKTHPETALEDTATLLIADQNFKLGKSILGKMHKAGKDINYFTDWFKQWYSYPQFAKSYTDFQGISELVEGGSYGSANSKIDAFKQSLIKNETLIPLFKNLIESSSKIISEAEQKAIEKELAAYIQYPVKAGQHKRVGSLEFPDVKYDIFLPSKYDHSGKTRLPIMYTFSPGGGGMVGHFKQVAEEMGIIVVGNLESKNGVSSDVYNGSSYAMTLDVRTRVHFDPTAQFSAGMSGGGWTAYTFARQNATQIAGVLAMGAWLGRQYDGDYDWHKEKLLVARTHGNNDGGAKGFLGRDAAYFKSYKVTDIKDWEFPGGHVSAPPEIQRLAFTWLLDKRKTQNDSEQKDALQFFQKLQAYVASGSTQKAFEESMKTLMTKPRTWHSYMAQKTIDKLMNMPMESLEGTFKNINDLPGKLELLDYFAFQLEGAALLGRKNIVVSSFECLKNLKAGLKRWDLTAFWFLAGAPIKEVRKPEIVIDYLGSKKSLNANEGICLGAAYASIGDMEKAKEMLKKVQKQVNRKDKHSSRKFEAFKKMLN